MRQPGDDDPDHPHEEKLNAKKEFSLLQHRLRHLPPRSRARLQGRFTQALVDETVTVDTPRGPLSFVLLGRTAGSRAMNLLTKQPATIDWIDAFRPDSVFWDVGANVGVYTLYAALRPDTAVVAFEPAAVNYYLLSANCEANHLANVQCLPVGLGRERALARLDASQFAAAESFSFHEMPTGPAHGRQTTLVSSMDALIDDYGLACPNYIKIDAPGLIEQIVAGGTRMLRRPEVRELHVELREDSSPASV